ncbi:sphingosine 1-phosphate receptor 2 isoform X2 [Polypterus senegalus]|uniref:sphingosine 1-phosphate receptor 2 isoform X2 n=1 Tax=Polypterus senegalus TaxID=55291 RepID=UPI001963D833|nr:sphingosine 1-phosphate receptor 2 isoform X2 [Polypterus senegalus]
MREKCDELAVWRQGENADPAKNGLQFQHQFLRKNKSACHLHHQIIASHRCVHILFRLLSCVWKSHLGYRSIGITGWKDSLIRHKNSEAGGKEKGAFQKVTARPLHRVHRGRRLQSADSPAERRLSPRSLDDGAARWRGGSAAASHPDAEINLELRKLLAEMYHVNIPLQKPPGDEVQPDVLNLKANPLHSFSKVGPLLDITQQTSAPEIRKTTKHITESLSSRRTWKEIWDHSSKQSQPMSESRRRISLQPIKVSPLPKRASKDARGHRKEKEEQPSVVEKKARPGLPFGGSLPSANLQYSDSDSKGNSPFGKVEDIKEPQPPLSLSQRWARKLNKANPWILGVSIASSLGCLCVWVTCGHIFFEKLPEFVSGFL